MGDERSILTFIIFFTVALSIYGGANFYIIRRGWQVLPDRTRVKRGYLALSVTAAASFILGRLLMSLSPGPAGEVFVWIGAFWLSIMVHLFFICVIIDMVRLADLVFPLIPRLWKEKGSRARTVIGITAAGAAVLITAAGFVNSLFVRTKSLDIDMPFPDAPHNSLTVAVATDLHVGSVMNSRRLRRIVDRLNAGNPDIVLLPGDIVDGSIHPGRAGRIKKELARISAPYGVYACAGNHEFIAGIDTAAAFIRSAGITFLRDEAREIAGCIILAARDDVSGAHFAGTGRKPLEEILRGADRSKPVVLMDHTPSNLDRAVKNGVDLQVSGHTHHGQIFPFDLITGWIYENDWGYMKKGDTHFYVSCGAGTWGPPVRTNSVSEIVLIKCNFK